MGSPVGVCSLEVDTIENADLDTFKPVSILVDGTSSGEPINLLVFDSALLSDTFRLCTLLLKDEAVSNCKILSSTIGLNTFGARNKYYN